VAADRRLIAERIDASGAYADDATLTDMANDDTNLIVREALAELGVVPALESLDYGTAAQFARGRIDPRERQSLR
jgi:hypothetical protein